MHENIGIEIARYFSRVHSRGRSLELELRKVSSLKPCARHSFSRKYSTSFCSWFYRYSRKGTCIILHPVLLKVQNVAQNALPSAVFSACSAPLRTRMTTSPQIIAENRLDFIFHHFCIHIPLDPLFSLRLRSDLQLTCRIFLKFPQHGISITATRRSIPSARRSNSPSELQAARIPPAGPRAHGPNTNIGHQTRRLSRAPHTTRHRAKAPHEHPIFNPRTLLHGLPTRLSNVLN